MIDLHHLEKFYSNSYFTRQWIVQEITLSQNALLLIGRFSVSYDKFAMASFVLPIVLNYRDGSYDSKLLASETFLRTRNIVAIKSAYGRKQKGTVSAPIEPTAHDNDAFLSKFRRLKKLDFIDQ